MIIYNEPEFKVVKMTNEDVLTTSTLEQLNSDWEAHIPDEGATGIITL
jgi:hypothetical protein